MNYSETISVSTKGETDIINITDDVSKIVEKTEIKRGICCVFVSGATGAITTIEYEPGLLQDLPKALERLFPKNIEYKHHETWHDGNGHSHVRAAIMGPSLTVPIKNGNLTLGTWQQIVFVELDVRKRKREIIVQIVGD
jgi:secondary thiamine-phosphate synthase enzyme